jgi:hypothetical protein
MSTLYRHPLLRTLVGSVLLTVGLGCLTFLVINLVTDLSIWILGRRTTAEVVAAWVEETSEENATEQTFEYFVRYRFSTSSSEVFTRTTRVGVQEWGGLGMGGPVGAIYQEQRKVPTHGVGSLERGILIAVVYFPPYPAHNRLDDSRFVPLLACTYVPLIGLSWAGLTAGRNLLGSRGEAYGPLRPSWEQ